MGEFKIDRNFLESKLFREVVLKSEIDAFLHDIDKMSKFFLLQMAEHKKEIEICKLEHKDDYHHKKCYADDQSLKKIFDIEKEINFYKQYLSKQFEIPLSDLNLKISIQMVKNDENEREIANCNSYLGETATYHHKQEKLTQYKISLLPWIIGSSFTACDGLDSKYDKGASQKQKCDSTYIANPFGYEFFPLDFKFFDTLESKRREFLCKIAKRLDEYKDQNKQDWYNIREDIFREAGRDNRDGVFRIALGETQRSANDVVLFDHVFSVAALLKSMLVRVILESEVCKNKEKTYFLPVEKGKNEAGLVAASSWNLFSIAINVTEFLYRVRKIGEIKGFYGRWKETCDKLREIFEKTMPVGTELYRDLQGIHFLIPRFEIPGLEAESQKLEEEFKTILQEKAVEIIQDSKYFSCKTRILGEKDSDNLLKLSDAVKWSQNAFSFPVGTEDMEEYAPLPGWLNAGDSHRVSEEICHCCRQRTQNRHKLGYCDECYDLRKNRITQWYENKEKQTIWLNELSDENSQIALISIQFDLSNWLNGEEIKSLILDFSTKKTKYPSMARIRRIWSTTLLFFEEVQEYLATCLPMYTRLKFEAITKDLIRKDCFGTIEFGSKTIDVYVHQKSLGKYEILSCCDIKTLFPKKEEKEIFFILSQDLEDKKNKIELKIQEEEEKGEEKSFVLPYCSLKETESYSPLIDIVTTPQLFQFLCPANQVDNVIRFIKGKYEREMSKVLDRLPLHINALYFKNNFPLYVVLETAQNMLSREFLRSSKEKEDWKVMKIEDETLEYSADKGQKEPRKSKAKKFTLKPDQGFKYNWTVDIMTGDSTLEDNYYPNFEARPVEKEGRKNSTEFLHREDEKHHYIHVKELQEGDTVCVAPSTFDFAFIDSNEMRFVVQGETRRHPMIQEGRRAYYLEDIEIFQTVWNILDQEKYSQSQLEKLQYLLLQKRKEWAQYWNQSCEEEKDTVDFFITSILKHPNQLGEYFKKEGKEKEYAILHKACRNGMIFDIMEYYCKLCGKTIQEKKKRSS